MENRTLLYIRQFNGDIVLSKKPGQELYRILWSNRSFGTFPKIRWGKLYSAVEDCDYISDTDWEEFVCRKFLESLKRDDTVEWDTNNGSGYTWAQMVKKIGMSNDTIVLSIYKE